MFFVHKLFVHKFHTKYYVYVLKLLELMDFGAKYCIPSKYSVNDILIQLNLHLDLFIYKITVDYEKITRNITLKL